MWVLESDGEAFQGKKLWLRPGKKFLFGRTTSEPGAVTIDDKTISRKHLVVEVASVGPADCVNAGSWSKLTIEDLNTKIGTMLNGEQIRAKRVHLEKDHNVVTLGRYKNHFTFTWVPVSFTFSFTAKEAKADPYTSLYNLLGPLDIKVLIDFKRGQTTHVVAKKRNTSKGLQALVDGKYIVHNDSFIQAIVAATTAPPPTEENGIAKSPLELSWADNFPDELRYLPPRGDEPTQRDPIAYAPDPARKDCFEGYTFIFYEKRQYDTLLAPISEGAGKALHREVVPGETEVRDFVAYVKNVAGEKGLGQFDDGSEGKGVVVVRFNPVKGAASEWYSEFNKKVSLFLDHRLIEQNEFLDAILGNDASVLRRPLEIELSGLVAPPATANTVMTSQRLRSPPPDSTSVQSGPTTTTTQPPARRGRSRRTVTTKFKGFDSDDETPANNNSDPATITPIHTLTAESQSQSLFVTQDPQMELDPAPFHQPDAQRSDGKRKSPPMNYELDDDEEDTIEQIVPAATALKKRRLADDAARRRRGESTPPPPDPKPEVTLKILPSKKKSRKEVDVLEVARLQREKAEEQALAEVEKRREELNTVDIEAIRDLAIVEDMDVKRSTPPIRPSRADEGDRWDDKWNGRKNFKKFRRRGGENGRRVLDRVIVPLEEAKKKDYGIGDDYWLEGDSHTKKKKGHGKTRDLQDVSQAESQPSRPKNNAPARAAEILAKEEILDDEVLANSPHLSSDIEPDEPVPPPASKTSSRLQKSQKLVDKTNASQNVSPRKKRVASTTLTKPVPAKKAKAAPIEVHESEDSDDEFKFRFRKRA